MGRNRFLPLVLLAAAVSALLSGCSGKSPDGDSRSPEAAPIRIGHFPNLTHAPALLARERGEFEKAFAPRKVEWRLFTAGPSAIEATFAKQVDLLYVGPGPALNGFAKSGGSALHVLAGATEGGAGLVVREDSGIATPAQLAGHRIATPQNGNTQDIAFRTFLAKNGLTWTDRGGTVNVAPIPPADQMPLFEKKELDGSWAVEPWLSRLVVEAGGKLLVDEATLWPEGRYPTTIFVASNSFSDPTLLRTAADVNARCVAALASADAAARSDVERILLRLSGKSLGRPVLDAAWSRLSFRTDLPAGAFDRLAGDALALGFLSAKPDLSGLVLSPAR